VEYTEQRQHKVKSLKDNPYFSYSIHLISLFFCILVFLFRYNQYVLHSLQFRQPYKLVANIVKNPEIFTSGFFDSISANNTSLYYSIWTYLINSTDYMTASIVMHILVSTLVAISIYVFTYTLSKRIGVTFLITFLLLNTNFLLACQVGANNFITHSPKGIWMGIGFLILSLAMHLKGKYVFFLMAQLLVVLIHPTLGFNSFVIFTPVLIHDYWRKKKQYIAFYGLIIGGYIFLQYWVNKTNVNLSPEDLKLWLHSVSMVNGAHVFIDGQGGVWKYFVSFLFIFLAYIAQIVFHVYSGQIDKKDKTILILVGAVILWCIILTPFIYYRLHNLPFLILPYRMLGAITPIMICFTLCSVMLKQNFSFLTSFFIGLCFGAILLSDVFGAFVFSICMVMLSFSRGKSYKYLFNMAIISIIIIIASLYGFEKIFFVDKLHLLKLLPGHYIKGTLFNYINSYSVLTQFISACMLVCLFVYLGSIKKTQYNRDKIVYFFVPIITITLLFAPVRDNREKYLSSLNDAIEVGGWIDRNAPHDKPILVPPTYNLFYTPIWEAIANRSSLLQITKYAWTYSNASLLKPFHEYYLAMGVDITKINSRREFRVNLETKWKNLTTLDFKKLAKKYNASYIIIEKKRQLNFPIVYENTSFRIFALGNNL